MKTYAEKLKDPRWQRKRLEIMERDGFRCLNCRSETKPLHVHHKEYRSGAEPWEYPDNNFETLCEDCHSSEHSIDDSNSITEKSPPHHANWMRSIDKTLWHGASRKTFQECASIVADASEMTKDIALLAKMQAKIAEDFGVLKEDVSQACLVICENRLQQKASRFNRFER